MLAYYHRSKFVNDKEKTLLITPHNDITRGTLTSLQKKELFCEIYP